MLPHTHAPSVDVTLGVFTLYLHPFLRLCPIAPKKGVVKQTRIGRHSWLRRADLYAASAIVRRKNTPIILRLNKCCNSPVSKDVTMGVFLPDLSQSSPRTTYAAKKRACLVRESRLPNRTVAQSKSENNVTLCKTQIRDRMSESKKHKNHNGKFQPENPGVVSRYSESRI